MNIETLERMVEARKDNQNYLSFGAIQSINEELALFEIMVEYETFKDLCNYVFYLYNENMIPLSKAQTIIKLCCKHNKLFRKESHRHIDGLLFQYSEKYDAYTCVGRCTTEEYQGLLHYLD